jgi:signal transduction histidine kinase
MKPGIPKSWRNPISARTESVPWKAFPNWLSGTLPIQQYSGGGPGGTSQSATLADPTQIHQVLMNLCTNAHHAMIENGGVLTVRLLDVSVYSAVESRKLDLTAGGYLCLQVIDTGTGMPQDVRARIFDPFFTTKERAKGTERGLSVVHGIVRSHGGTITVHSKPGKGTAFAVYLPIIQSDAKPVNQTAASIKGGSERILFVDDE